MEGCLLFPWLLPTILICYSFRIFFNNDVWYVFGQNLYYKENVRLLIIIAYTVVKLPFALRMVKAAFYAIDEELEDAARNLGASRLVTFLRVKLPIVLPSVLAVFALNFNALFTEYDMGATFQSSEGTTYAMVIQSMCNEEGRDGMNMNASGRRCASTVFIMIVSGLIRRNYKVRNPDGTVSTKKFGYRIVRGGATFYVPAIERIDQLDMCLTQVAAEPAEQQETV